MAEEEIFFFWIPIEDLTFDLPKVRGAFIYYVNSNEGRGAQHFFVKLSNLTRS